MKPRISVAEDDIAISEALQLLLEDEGYEVEIMLEGEQVRKMHAPLPALLLLDVWMRGTDGRDMCRHLKSQPATKHLPIILLSAHNEVAAMAKEAEADDFLLKPFNINELLALIEKYVS